MRNPWCWRAVGCACARAGELTNQPAVQPRSPAFVDTVIDAAVVSIHPLEVATGSLTIEVLEFGQNCRLFKGEIGVDLGAHPAGRIAAFLGRDENDTVRGTRPVNGRGVGALEHAQRLNIIGIDVVQRVAEVESCAGSDEGSAAAVCIGYGDSINHEQRLVVARDRVLAADDDVGRSALGAGRRDCHTGNLAFELLHHVLGARLIELLRADLLLGRSERALLSRQAESSHYHALQLCCRRGEAEVLNYRCATERHRRGARLESEATGRHSHRRSVCTYRRGEGVPTLVVREPADSQRRNTHARAYYWCSTRACDLATDGRSLGISDCWGKPERDARYRKEARDLTCHSHTTPRRE